MAEVIDPSTSISRLPTVFVQRDLFSQQSTRDWFAELWA
jgi:hypothetical protein